MSAPIVRDMRLMQAYFKVNPIAKESYFRNLNAQLGQ